MAKVSPLQFSNSQRDLGEFKVKMHNLLNEADCEAYASLRTRANDNSSGIKIERIQQLSRKIVEYEKSGDDEKTVTTEDIYILVEWWEKPVKADKGDSDEEVASTQRSWSHEGTVPRP